MISSDFLRAAKVDETTSMSEFGRFFLGITTRQSGVSVYINCI